MGQFFWFCSEINFGFSVLLSVALSFFRCLASGLRVLAWQGFFGFGVRCDFLFFTVLSVTSHSADTVMILIFSIKTDVMLFSPHVTNVSDRSGF